MDMSRFTKIEDGQVNLPTFPVDGKTEMYFFDINGKECEKDKAVTFVARICDKDGNIISESWGDCTPKKEEQKTR